MCRITIPDGSPKLRGQITGITVEQVARICPVAKLCATYYITLPFRVRIRSIHLEQYTVDRYLQSCAPLLPWGG